jgi:hypothetical protein
MSARSADIKKFGPLFKSGSMTWVALDRRQVMVT